MVFTTRTGVKSFKKCSISSALDGTEDDAVLEESEVLVNLNYRCIQ
jgi:hypothetical protein